MGAGESSEEVRIGVCGFSIWEGEVYWVWCWFLVLGSMELGFVGGGAGRVLVGRGHGVDVCGSRRGVVRMVTIEGPKTFTSSPGKGEPVRKKRSSGDPYNPSFRSIPTYEECFPNSTREFTKVCVWIRFGSCFVTCLRQFD